MKEGRAEQILDVYKDIDRFARYLAKYYLQFSRQFPEVDKEGRQIFIYELMARLADILETDMKVARDHVWDLVIDNDEYNRVQRIKAINLK